MNQRNLSRRRFVVALAAFWGGAGSTLAPGLLSTSLAWANSEDPADDEVHAAMVRMARLLYPHDALPDDVYARVLDQVLSDTASGKEFGTRLDAAAAALDERSGVSWLALDAAAQIDAMRSIENEPFFVAIQNTVRAGIYNSPSFWQHVGYEGPSKDFGGYRNRGAGEIDWLPEAE